MSQSNAVKTQYGENAARLVFVAYRRDQAMPLLHKLHCNSSGKASFLRNGCPRLEVYPWRCGGLPARAMHSSGQHPWSSQTTVCVNCKNRVMRCWCGYLSGVRCRLFAYGPADATVVPKPHQFLPHLNPDRFYLSGTG